jgi:hypothetical protein
MKTLSIMLVFTVALFVCLPTFLSPGPSAAEALPAQISDADYWKMISEFSEPNGYFQYDIVTSNETTYQYVLPELMKNAKAGGVYLGVGPEQNFTYIAALQPKIAFIIDIRRDMMLEHLIYKAVFEMSENRADFVSNLFSRKRPADLAADAPVLTLFQAYSTVPADRGLADEHFKSIMSRLKTTHHFPISAEDETRMRTMYMTFLREGVVNFSASFMSPGYASLMLATDGAGKNWSYLVSKENYDRVRALQLKNLIVPLVGDFAGPKAIRMTGQYLKDHGAIANVFYISNVEDYIQTTWPAYAGNIASLPIDSSSVFIRWAPGTVPSLVSISDFNRSQSRVR